MQDLFHQDVVEMIERETRSYELWSIETPDHPDFLPAYELLWGAFGPNGEMEREEAIRRFLLDDSYEPTATGTRSVTVITPTSYTRTAIPTGRPPHRAGWPGSISSGR